MSGPQRPILRIFTAPGCASCRTALALAEAVRHARPEHPVEVVDLGEHPDRPLPAGVVGTPTYLLGGRVVSLGNPDLVDLLGWLDAVGVSVE